MADDNENTEINLDESTETVSASAKKGGLGTLFPNLLKWLIIVICAIILIVTVVVITMKIMGGNTSSHPDITISEEYEGKREILDWYQSLGSIRTTTADPNPASVVVEVVLGYKKDDKATSAEITARTIEIKDFLRRYFSEKTAEELRPQNEDKLRIEIRNAINDDILSTSKIKEVRFLTKEVVEQ
ncbi:MAG: flagellar basal body-associated FliL family protein [Treponema sp.]|jgi:flagellar FliL protein|nr:flagellar basal body-associated FliL family protein [Treponema sp.]